MRPGESAIPALFMACEFTSDFSIQNPKSRSSLHPNRKIAGNFLYVNPFQQSESCAKVPQRYWDLLYERAYLALSTSSFEDFFDCWWLISCRIVSRIGNFWEECLKCIAWNRPHWSIFELIENYSSCVRSIAKILMGTFSFWTLIKFFSWQELCLFAELLRLTRFFKWILDMKWKSTQHDRIYVMQTDYRVVHKQDQNKADACCMHRGDFNSWWISRKQN